MRFISILDELSGLLEEDELFARPRLPYVKPSVVTSKVEPSNASSPDAPATKLDTNESVQEEVRTFAHDNSPLTPAGPILTFSTVVESAKSFEGKSLAQKEPFAVLHVNRDTDTHPGCLPCLRVA
jgi:hypothetical protein